jgi:AhpC/TSA family
VDRFAGGADAGMRRLAFALMFVLVFAATVADARPLPDSTGAPKVGQKAPDFRLQEVGGGELSLANTLSSQREGPWVLLVFYRGYW